MALSSIKWPFARFKFIFTATEEMHFPQYSGSMIRGAFGHALRKTACMTKEKDCKLCPLYESCAYSRIFETPPPSDLKLQSFSQVPNGFVIEPFEWGEKHVSVGENVEFELVLFGRVINDLALIIHSFSNAFKRGIAHHSQGLLKTVFVEENGNYREIYNPNVKTITGASKIESFEKNVIINKVEDNKLKLTFTTPLRLQKQGKILTADDLDARTLIVALARRIDLVLKIHANIDLQLDFKKIIADTENVTVTKNLKWAHWVRHSARQKQLMALDGVVGDIELSNLSEDLTYILQIGRWTHVGKNGTFGLGKYIISK